MVSVSSNVAAPRFNPRLDKRHQAGKIFQVVCFIGTITALILLVLLMFQVFTEGIGRLDRNAFLGFPSQLNPREAGFRASLLGSIWILVLTVVFSLPLGVGAAIYLEEYAPENRLTQILELNISNLAGVPSVVYGMLGLGLFVRLFNIGPVVLSGALTMGLVILPVIIVAARESIRAVPQSYRQASYGLGATRWETISNHVLPYAFPGILTGTIIAMSRAIGDSAALLVVGGLVFIQADPSILSRFTVLPLQIFFAIGQPRVEFRELAAAGIIILLIALLVLNGAAIFLRSHFERENRT